jgi:hypothetical protein
VTRRTAERLLFRFRCVEGELAAVRVRTCLIAVAVCAAVPSASYGSTASGPHETLESTFTATTPDTPSGFGFHGVYHAAGDPSADPPYMRGMIFFPPDGLRYDTSVPDRCTATDLALELRGAAACPAGSRLGGGTTATKFMGRFPTTVALDFLNGDHEQIILAHSQLLSTVSRGDMLPDGSVRWASPTCYPALRPPGCLIDNVLQLESTMSVPAYTRTIGGVVRSYLTTPPTCPASGQWDSVIRLWWDDGSVDTVTTEQPCTP